MVAVTPSVRSPRAGLLACLAGFALAAAVQVAGPLPGPPLYDGVVVAEPYVYLQPSGNEPGGARWATTNVPVVAGVSPAIALGTPEHPPQAQLIAGAGALAMPPGTTALVVSITPVPPTVVPASGAVYGNVYRISIVNQVGAPVTGLAGKQVTLGLRDPTGGSTDSRLTIELLAGGAWQPTTTVSAAVAGTYETTGLVSFGDFALIGTVPPGGGSLSPYAWVTGSAIVVGLLLLGISVVRARRGSAPGER
jgi:hypothetical protein